MSMAIIAPRSAWAKRLSIRHMEFASGPALRDALQQLETQSQTRSAAAIQHVLDFCARSNIAFSDAPLRSHGVTASCRQEEGGTLDRVMFHARHCDLVVMGRSQKPNRLPPDFLDSAARLWTPRPDRWFHSITDGDRTIMVCWRERRCRPRRHRRDILSDPD